MSQKKPQDNVPEAGTHMHKTAAAHGRLIVAGLGPGDHAHMTSAVVQALQNASDVVGYLPYVQRARQLLQATTGMAVAAQGKVTWHASDNREELERARHALTLAACGKSVVVVSSGDPGVFAMAAAVFEAVERASEPEHSQWQRLDVQILPGITAMLAAAARAGAPLGHDFCCMNLSDNLKPWPVIEQRLQLAMQADFALAVYNPRSRSRPQGFARFLQVLRAYCEPQRLMIFARAIATAEEHLHVCTLAEARPEMADMRTVVLVGNSMTRRTGRWVYTPRHYGPMEEAAEAAEMAAGAGAAGQTAATCPTHHHCAGTGNAP